MKKKIAVVGLYDIKNAGDNILCDCTRYMIQEYFGDVDIVEVDVNPLESRYKGFDRIRYQLSVRMNKLGEKLFSYENGSRVRYLYEYFLWWIRINKSFRTKMKDVDAIVFAGGGFLKFRTQGLNYYVEQIVKIAKKGKIPVMMNGVGIEGYDEKDIRCQQLKKAINSDVMKVITTRDDVDTLQNCYITNPDIVTARVGDPALWVPECYDVEKKPCEKGLVGINLIRGKIYQAYGNNLSEFQLMNLYIQLLRELDRRKIRWVLFSNGMKADQTFGKKMLKRMKIKDKTRLLDVPSDPMDFINTLQQFNVVFGARLHACITSYALDIPVVGLIWNEKLRIFSSLIQKKSHFFEENELDVKRIVDAIEDAMDDSYDPEIRDRLRSLTKDHLHGFLAQI